MNSSGVVAEPGWAEAALTTQRLRRDVLAGLACPKKSLPCKYLYDEQGARLFELICELDEYYPTRTELAILRENIEEIASLLGPSADLVDLGSGSGLKTRLLLDHLDRPASHRPVDVAGPQLLECAAQVARLYPGLSVTPLCADYTRSFELPPPPPGSGGTTVFFPGSTIGNFEPKEAEFFLRRIAWLCGRTGHLLIGVDLKKPPTALHLAYNDSQGVTAKFNLNLLARLNRELEAGFDLERFKHRAIYNVAAGRIEMHLISLQEQTVPVNGHSFDFARGESIVTEHSYKYTVGEFEELAARAGLERLRGWTDDRRWFSVLLLKPRPGIIHGRQSRAWLPRSAAVMTETGPDPASDSPLIELVGASKSFDSLVALAPTDLRFAGGKTTVLIGPSGCGKSTILRLIIGLIQPTSGQVRFEGQVLAPSNILELRRRMGYVIQEGGLFSHLTARDNVLLLPRHLRQPKTQMEARLSELRDLTRLSAAVLSRYPVELSGGQRQRVSLIRALMLRPEVLLLDEPLAALDAMVRVTLQTELRTIFEQLRQTVILVTHELAEAAWLGHQIVLLRHGHVVQVGTLKSLRDQPAECFVEDFINAQRNLSLT